MFPVDTDLPVGLCLQVLPHGATRCWIKAEDFPRIGGTRHGSRVISRDSSLLSVPWFCDLYGLSLSSWEVSESTYRPSFLLELLHEPELQITFFLFVFCRASGMQGKSPTAELSTALFRF